MTEQEFFELARRGYNRIPLVRELPGDLETPLSVYLKLANAPYSYLLESVVGGERFGRYSFIGLPARTVLRVRGHLLLVEVDGKQVEEHSVADPLAFIADFQARYKAAPLAGLPRFTGGLAGYFGYDTIRYIEKRLSSDAKPALLAKPDALHTPDILLMLTEELAVFDNLAGKL
jgi:anthranilate synthase component 1